ncbi:MAG: FG-GAP repeat domain-containing protein [Thermoanaerobaculia bacterium]
MIRATFHLLLASALFSANGISAPCDFHRLEAPRDAAAWASSIFAVADFDGDRVTDVVISDGSVPAIRFLRRDGSSTDLPLDIGGDIRGAAIGDFDGDGRPDLVMTSFEFEAFLAINRLPVGFEVERFPEADGSVEALAADFDGDGNLDLALVGGGLPRVLYGDGNGDFPRSAATGFSGSGPALVADWNGDGRPDIVAASSGHRFVVHLSEGASGFATGGSVEVDGFPNEILAGDLTGDGRPDLVVLTSTNLAVAEGTGVGFAAPRATIFAQAAADGAAIGDFDRDGMIELAMSLAGRTEFIDGGVVYLPPALFVSRMGTPDNPRIDVWEFLARRSTPLFTGDFDGNGQLDLMAGGAVYRGSGVIGFETESRIALGFAPSMIAAGDYDGDGLADLAVASSDSAGIRLYRGRRSGGVVDAGSLAIGDATSLTAADFDQDGRADLVVGRSGELLVHYGMTAEDKLFESPISIAVAGQPMAVTAIDVTADGRLNLLFAESSGQGFTLHVLSRDVPRGFLRIDELDAGMKAPTAIGLADVDRNGIADLIVVARGKAPIAPPFEPDGTGIVYRRDGSGRVVTQDLLFEGLSPIAVEGGDWDGDGDDDLLIAQQFGTLLLLRNEGGILSEHALGARATLELLRTDLDRDDQTDLLLLQTSESILRLEHRGGELVEAGGFVAGSVPVAMAVGDFDGDGVIDVAVANEGSSSVSLVYGSCGRTRAVRRR